MTSFLLQQLAHKRCSCRSTVYLWLKVKRFTRYVAKNSGCLQGILISCTNYPESLHQKICQTDKFIVSIVDRLCFFSLWLVLYAALKNISLCTIAYYVFFQYLPETDMLEDSLLSPYLGLIASKSIHAKAWKRYSEFRSCLPFKRCCTCMWMSLCLRFIICNKRYRKLRQLKVKPQWKYMHRYWPCSQGDKQIFVHGDNAVLSCYACIF